ncbi:hypothetical protein ALC53_03774 [Atta colombica]|uniref:Uncharacterized protein n=1 Tax=Atta colombica TaxID=520822 RepID=A0A195BM66_9HYME|nr:hypothetical protein ALC53_03774 [Atta colombica]
MTAFAPGGRLWTRRSGYSSYSLFLRLRGPAVEPSYPLCPMDNPATERKIKSWGTAMQLEDRERREANRRTEKEIKKKREKEKEQKGSGFKKSWSILLANLFGNSSPMTFQQQTKNILLSEEGNPTAMKLL